MTSYVAAIDQGTTSTRCILFDHDARIVIRKITSSADFHAAAFQVLRLICNARAHCVDIRLFAHQLNAQPMVLRSCVVTQQDRRAIIHRNQNVDCTVIIEISNRHAPSRKRLRKDRIALLANVLKALPGAAKQKRWLFVFHL